MVELGDEQPRVAPGRPKGSGSRAPWIVLAVLATIGIAIAISIAVAILLLRT